MLNGGRGGTKSSFNTGALAILTGGRILTGGGAQKVLDPQFSHAFL